MPKYVKLSVLACLLGMSAGAVLASSLRDTSSSRLAGDENMEGSLTVHPARSASTSSGVEVKPLRQNGESFEATPMHAIPARSPNAPLPPSWQSLLPGAIRL